MNRFALLSLILATAPASPAVGQVIDFESVPASGNPTLTTLTVGAFTFTGSHFHAIGNFTPCGGKAQNGSAVYLSNEGGSQPSSIRMQRTDGQPFSLSAFDAAEDWVNLCSGFPNATAIEVLAILPDLSTSTQVFTMDGLLDGAGGVADFQTFMPIGLGQILAATFSGVDAAGAHGFAYDIDNIDTAPSCVVPYGAGCAGSGGFVPTLAMSPCLVVGNSVTLNISKALGGSTALLAFGLTQTTIPIGTSGCDLLLQPLFPATIAIPLGGSGSGNGGVVLTGTVPATLAGLSFTMQSFVADPASPIGFVTTNGLDIAVQ